MKEQASQSQPELEKAVIKLLENAIGVTITERNRREKVREKYDVDVDDLLWRINRELGIKIGKSQIRTTEKNDSSIEDILDATLRAWRRGPIKRQ